MIIFILSVLLVYAVDIFMVGITFQAIANKYQWKITIKKSFIILFFIFAVLEIYLWPLVYSVDATITVRNEAIASLLEIPPDYPFINFFELGLFEFFTWAIQAVLAGLIGQKILENK
ncbi:MAG: hypothetical protein ACYC57_10725 [Thermoleophilia bacterium]